MRKDRIFSYVLSKARSSVCIHFPKINFESIINEGILFFASNYSRRKMEEDVVTKIRVVSQVWTKFAKFLHCSAEMASFMMLFILS